MKELTIFEHRNFGKLPLLTIDGKEYFGASDVAKKLGYSNPNKAVRDHCKEKGCTFRSVPTSGGRQRKRFIDEGNLYRLITNSKLPEAEEFESWVFDEVLPSIRKHGAYMTPETIEQALLNPDTIIQLATTLKVEQEKRKFLESENNELKPKATYHDAVLQSETLLTTTSIAKDLGMGAVTLNKKLHELGVQYKRGDRWYLYHKYQDKGYTQSKTHLVAAGKTKETMYWTQKGKQFVLQLLEEREGILPVVKSDAS